MKIRELSCEQFAGLTDKTVSFEDGINVVYGKNESGKSTLVNLLSRTLFQEAGIDARSAKGRAFKALYYPAERRGETAAVQNADGRVSVETDCGVYTLTKEWGEDPRSKLKTPEGDIIRGEEQVKSAVEELLQYGEGVYTALLLSPQSGADDALKALLEAQAKTGAEFKEDLSATVTKAFAESDGISADEVGKRIEEKLTQIKGDHWDAAGSKPERHPKGGRWATKVGSIMQAYYAVEDARDKAAKRDQLENDLQAAIEAYKAAEGAYQQAKDACSSFAKVKRQLEERAGEEEALDRLRREQKQLTRELREWPVQEAALEKAKALRTELTQCEKLELCRRVREMQEKITPDIRADLERPYPQADEITQARKAQREITKLENRLCGMNLQAAIKMLDGNTLEVVSLRTGQRLDTAGERLAITEAVKITVPGVMELQLAPADVNVADVEHEIAAQCAALDSILVKYGQGGVEELETLAVRIGRSQETAANVQSQIESLLNGKPVSEVEAEAAGIPAAVRSKAEIQQDIRVVCENTDVNVFIGVAEKTIRDYTEQYGSIERLAEKEADAANSVTEAEKRLREMADIPEEYRGVSDPQGHLDALERQVEERESAYRDTLDSKGNAAGKLETYQDSLTTDPDEELEIASRRLEEQKTLLHRWLHIQEVFTQQKEQLTSNPMEDIADRFSHNLSVISDGGVSSEFPQMDKLDMNIYSGQRRLNYGKLSEGTKETVYLAFRLAVLDHLFPDGGGVIVLDDPLTDMDEDRVAQSCTLIKDCAARHQVIFLTCREEYFPLLGGNEIRL